MFREWNRVIKIKLFAHTLSCSPQSKSEQMVKQIISIRMLFGDLEHITSTRMLWVTSTRIICGDFEYITSTRILLVTSTRIICDDLEHITSTRMLWVTLTRIICGDLEHITSTRMLLVTSIRKLPGSTIQSKHFLWNIRDHILSGLKISSFLENSRG